MNDIPATVCGETGSRLDTYLRRVTPFGFSGALLVARDDEILVNEGYGLADRARKVPNTSATVFNLGSITKQFTAAAVLKLEMAGRLRTGDRLGDHLAGVPPDKEQITLHHLLTHTAGVINATGEDYEIATLEQAVGVALGAPLLFPPATRFRYSNAGYSLLAAVVETASGEPYEGFLGRELFQPAGMAHTGYRLPDWGKKSVAHWYVLDDDFGTPLEKPYPSWHLLGNGDMLSTTEDMLRWQRVLQGDAVLSDEAKEKLFTPFLNDYAYGWDVSATPHGLCIEHGGSSAYGSSAEFAWFADSDLLVVVFCNQSFGEQALAGLVKEKLVSLIFGDEVPAPPPVPAVDLEALRPFAGEYRLSGGGGFVARVANGALRLAPSDQRAINLLFYPGTGELERHQDLNARTAQVFGAALQGDYALLRACLANPVARFDNVRELFARTAADCGAERIEVPGSTPSQFIPGAVDTAFQLVGPDRAITLVSIWREGQNVGLARLDFVSQPIPAVPFLPGAAGGFVGYDLLSAQSVRAHFHKGDGDMVTAVSFPTAASEIAATRSDGCIRSHVQ
jgi:CubicO group peptidase (beta-lactamase class C family)